jgi:hypothetical protein
MSALKVVAVGAKNMGAITDLAAEESTAKIEVRQIRKFVEVVVDYALWRNVTLGVEYDHFDLGGFGPVTSPFSNGGTTLKVTDTSGMTADVVLARLNYKFGRDDDVRPLK